MGSRHHRRQWIMQLCRELRPEDVLVEHRAVEFLREGDTPPGLEEIRPLAGKIYRETRKIRDSAAKELHQANSERERAEHILKLAVAALKETTDKLEGCHQAEARITAIEKRVTTELERARKAGWLKRLLGDF